MTFKSFSVTALKRFISLSTLNLSSLSLFKWFERELQKLPMVDSTLAVNVSLCLVN